MEHTQGQVANPTAAVGGMPTPERSRFLREIGEIAEGCEILRTTLLKLAKAGFQDSEETKAELASSTEFELGVLKSSIFVWANTHNLVINEKQQAQEAREERRDNFLAQQQAASERMSSLFDQTIGQMLGEITAGKRPGPKPGQAMPFGPGFLLNVPRGMSPQEAIAKALSGELDGPDTDTDEAPKSKKRKRKNKNKK
jgi:hypothetical protein